MSTDLPGLQLGEPNERQGEPAILLVGVGNEMRGDDGLGIVAARELRRRLGPEIRVVELQGDGATLMNEWTGATHVFVVDAISSGGPPGTLHCINARVQQLPKHFLAPSSHAFGVVEAIRLSTQIDRLPQNIMVAGIEAESFDQGIGLSNSVIHSFPEFLHLMEHEIRSIIEHASSSSAR